MLNKFKVYLAAPLFSDAEREFNQKLKHMLSQYFDVYLPQEDGGLLVNMISKGMAPIIACNKVFKMDINAINACDIFIFIMDGRTVDEGAAFELGYAYAKGKICYGLKTDPRQLLAIGNNPMIDAPIQNIFYSVTDLLNWAKSIAYDKEKSMSRAANC